MQMRKWGGGAEGKTPQADPMVNTESLAGLKILTHEITTWAKTKTPIHAQRTELPRCPCLENFFKVLNYTRIFQHLNSLREILHLICFKRHCEILKKFFTLVDNLIFFYISFEIFEGVIYIQ